MILEYIDAAMERAEYEVLEEDGSWYAHVPELQGVWANADTLEACRDELRSVVDEWVAQGLVHRDTFPELGHARIEVARMLRPMTEGELDQWLDDKVEREEAERDEAVTSHAA